MNMNESQAEIFEEFSGADRDDAVLTAETIDNFIAANKNYNESGRVEQGETEGVKWCEIEGVQVRKGDRRTNIIIVDFGDFRAVYS